MKKYLLLAFSSLAFGGFSQKITIGSGAEINIVGDNSASPTYTTTLHCDGDLEVQGILDLDHNATLVLGGDFISSTAGTNIQRGNSTVIFNGTSAQSIRRGISSNSNFGFYNLTLNNAAGLTINPTNIPTFTVYNILTPQLGTLTTGDVLVINALNPTNYGRIAYGNGNFSGEVIIEKDLSNTNAGWRHLSMPFGGAGDTWGSITKNDIELLMNNHSPANQINCLSWNSLPSGNADYASGWQPTQTTSTFTTAVAAYLNEAVALHAVSALFSFKGTLHNQTSIPFSLAFTRDPDDATGLNDAAVGWNFIPNPWPALVDVNALLNDADFEPAYKAIHIYNAVNGTSQAILRDNNVTKVGYNASGTTLLNATVNVPPLQAFWVKADQTGQQIILKAATMQSVEQPDVANAVFMKREIPIIRINAFDGDSLWDQLVIYFNAHSTRNFDLDGDAYYLPTQNKELPIIYAKEGDAQASIVSRPAITADSVEISFGASFKSQNYFLHADLDELPAEWHVYLRDKKTQKTVKLSHNTSIAFSQSEGISPDRFVLYFTKNSHDFNHLVTGEQPNIVARAAQNGLLLESKGVTGKGMITVYDASGKVRYQRLHHINTSETLHIPLIEKSQIMLVEVNVGGAFYTDKVFF